MMELRRWEAYFNDPIKIESKTFPATDPISSQAVIAARESGGDAVAFAHALLRALWVEEWNIDDPEIVAAVAEDCGLDGKAIIDFAQSPEAAAQYEDDTKQAIDRGVFGAPSYVVENEIFWGQDRLDLLAWRLGVTLDKPS